MVIKDRIIQLVKEKKTIYFVYGKEVEILDLMPNHLVYNDGKKDFINLFGGNGLQIVLEDLYETQAEAEWVAKMHTERTEKFEPPTWEEFIEMEEWCFFQKNHRQTIIRILGTKYLGVETNFERYFTGNLTKDNYIKACEYARNLFLGKENENE